MERAGVVGASKRSNAHNAAFRPPSQKRPIEADEEAAYAATSRGGPSNESCIGNRDVQSSEGAPRKREQWCSRGPSKEQRENAAHQQAILQSLASYLEGELMVRLQSYSELLADVEAVSKERMFYHDKLLRIEKVCERAQPYGSTVPLVESVLAILGSTTDRPKPC